MGSVNDEDREVDALVCLTDEYSFGLFILTEPAFYDEDIQSANEELIRSADLIYAERNDMAYTEFFQVLTPERWKYLCHYQTEETENDGYKLIYQVIAKLAVLVRNLEPKQGRIREEHDLWNEKWIIAHVRRTLISYGLYESGKS